MMCRYCDCLNVFADGNRVQPRRNRTAGRRLHRITCTIGIVAVLVAAVFLVAQELVERRMNALLDEFYPMYEEGHLILVQRTDGEMERGVLKKIEKDHVVLSDIFDKEREIPIEDLCAADRIRCEDDERAQYAAACTREYLSLQHAMSPFSYLENTESIVKERVQQELIPPVSFDPDAFAEFTDWLSPRIGKRLDQQAPLYPVGTTVAIRRVNGLVLRGKVEARTDEAIDLLTAQGCVCIHDKDISVDDRLLCDPEFRTMYCDVRAALLARKVFLSRGYCLPRYPGDLTLSTEEALHLADPNVLYEEGITMLQREELGEAFLYLSASCAQGYPPAQYSLGLMYYRGAGTGCNRERGIQWIALAAAKSNRAAQVFLQNERIAKEHYRAALARAVEEEKSRRRDFAKDLAQLEDTSGGNVILESVGFRGSRNVE
jgi:hypothetical protein